MNRKAPLAVSVAGLPPVVSRAAWARVVDFWRLPAGLKIDRPDTGDKTTFSDAGIDGAAAMDVEAILDTVKANCGGAFEASWSVTDTCGETTHSDRGNTRPETVDPTICSSACLPAGADESSRRQQFMGIAGNLRGQLTSHPAAREQS